MRALDLLRCPACESWSHARDREGSIRCRSCRLAAASEAVYRSPVPASITRQIGAGTVRLPNGESWLCRLKLPGRRRFMESGFWFSAASLEALAERTGYAVLEKRCHRFGFVDVACREWGERIDLETTPMSQSVPAAGVLSVGVMCRLDEVEGVAEIIATCLPVARRFLVVLDSTGPLAEQEFQGALLARMQQRGAGRDASITVRARRLGEDFGAQRSFLQSLADTPWVLQLDADERPSAGLVTTLGWAIAKAERFGKVSMGLRRLNIVDGVRTAHYPDTQYRLNRSSIRYKGIVHETPDVHWRLTGTFWSGDILHYMSGMRIDARSERYERMQKGAGAPFDCQLLRAPLN